MKKLWATLLACVMCVGMVGCQNNGQDAAILGTGERDGQPLSMRLLGETSIVVETVSGYGNGLVCIKGTYQDKEGYFYANEKGEVLNDTVYAMAHPFGYDRAFVKKADGDDWQMITGAGKTLDEKANYYRNYYTDGVPLTEEEMKNRGYTAVGTAVNGLAPAVHNGKLILIDTAGEAVLESTLVVDSASALGYDGERIAACRDGKLLIVDTAPTEEEAKQIATVLMKRAEKLYFVYHDETIENYYLQAGTEVTVNGLPVILPRRFYGYTHSSEELGDIGTLEDLRNATLSVYTQRTAQDYLFDNHFDYERGDEIPKFIEHEGKLYVGAGGLGISYLYNHDTIDILYRRAGAVVFSIAEEQTWYNKAKEAVSFDQNTHLYVMKATKNGWRLETFYQNIQLS